MNYDQFLLRHLPALERDQARYNLMLGLLNRAKKDPSKLRFWSLGNETACAVQTPPHYIVLGDLNEEQCQELARAVIESDFIGCSGAGQSAELFTKHLLKLGIPTDLEMPQRIYVLDHSPTYPACAGAGKRVNSEDLELFVDWYIRFSQEAVPNDPPRDRKRIEQAFADMPIFFWIVDGIPVSMAARTRETKDGSNISLVFTPPELRGNGYAGAVTAFACEDAFREGKKTCFLYTDLRNPISNRVYQKIGFKPWCDSATHARAKNFIQYRDANHNDFEFVRKLHHETLREYVEPVWGWDEPKQDKFIQDWFKPENVKIIQHKRSDVGLLVVEERKDDLFLASISTVPAMQGKGIGAVVIMDVMLRARNENKTLRLQVLKTNPRARSLYEKLGFSLEKETAHHYELKYEYTG